MDAKQTAAAMRERNRKVITLPSSGMEITIRKLTQWDFISGGSDIPTGSMTEGKPARHASVKVEQSARERAAIIFGRGVVSPRVVVDDAAECSEDEIHIYDLADDMAFVMDEIIEFSGLGQKAAVVENFRETEPPQSGDA